MIVIQVLGLPDLTKDNASDFERSLIEAFDTLKPDVYNDTEQVFCSFPKEAERQDLGKKIVVCVSQAHCHNNHSVRTTIAKTLKAAVSQTFPDSLVQCVVDEFNYRQGKYPFEL